MAPLHTQPVLTENDRLTGKYLGKHPGKQKHCNIKTLIVITGDVDDTGSETELRK